jgi:NTE family protein
MTPSESVHSVAEAIPPEHRPLPGQVVLVMQGGGAPGCYQAGVYQAMHEAGIEPDWVIGTSIGAINGAIIAGNKVVDRLPRLREFWSNLEAWFAGPWGSLTTVLAGVPGFFSPNPAVAWGVETRVGIERAALYSIDPLKKVLPKLVDFDLINSGKPRLTLGLVNVRSGQMRYFDSREGGIRLDHILGSSAIPPSFPAVRLDGEAYWDGGIYSNTPVEVVFDDNPRRNSVVFAAQIWHTRSSEPDSLAQVFMRQKDILFGSRSRSHIARHAQLHRMRHVVRELYKMLPDERRNTPEARELAAYGCTTVMHLLEINARPIAGESNMRDVDFSKAAIHARWQAGYADARAMIARRPWENPVDPLVGVAVYTSDPED